MVVNHDCINCIPFFGYFWARFGRKRFLSEPKQGSPTRRKEHAPLIPLPWRLRNHEKPKSWETRDFLCCKTRNHPAGSLKFQVAECLVHWLQTTISTIITNITDWVSRCFWNHALRPQRMERSGGAKPKTTATLQVEPDWDHVTRRTYLQVL